VGDLVVGEPQRGQARRHVGLIAAPVTRLLGGRAVVAQAVGLDDEAEVRPEEVDPEAVEPLLCEGRGQTRPPGDGEKAALELRVGEGEGVAVEEVAKGGSATAGKRRPQPLRIDEVEPVGCVDHGLELALRQEAGEIEQRPDRAGHRYAVAQHDLVVGHGPAVEADARAEPP
jgi:hypothetical protein